MAKKKKHKKIVSRTKDLGERCAEPTDYEKLAECVAKAIADENDKRINAYSVTGEWMKFVICPVFWLISVLSAVFCVGFFIYGCNMFKVLDTRSMISTQDIISIAKGFISNIFSLIFAGIAVSAFFAGKEFDRETDRQFVVSVFSGMVSLVALIVAFIALFIEVR